MSRELWRYNIGVKSWIETIVSRKDKEQNQALDSGVLIFLLHRLNRGTRLGVFCTPGLVAPYYAGPCCPKSFCPKSWSPNLPCILWRNSGHGTGSMMTTTSGSCVALHDCAFVSCRLRLHTTPCIASGSMCVTHSLTACVLCRGDIGSCRAGWPARYCHFALLRVVAHVPPVLGAVTTKRNASMPCERISKQ